MVALHAYLFTRFFTYFGVDRNMKDLQESVEKALFTFPSPSIIELIGHVQLLEAFSSKKGGGGEIFFKRLTLASLF